MQCKRLPKVQRAVGSGLAPTPQLSPGHSLLPAQPQQLRPPWGLRNVPCSSLSLEGPPPTPHLRREHLLAGPWSSSCLLVPPPFPDSPRSPAFAPPATLRFIHLGVCLLSGGWQRWSLNSLCPHDPTHIDKGNHGDTYRGRGRVTAAGRSVSAACFHTRRNALGSPSQRTTDEVAQTTGICFLAVLGAGSLRPRCLQGRVLPRPLRLSPLPPATPRGRPSACIWFLPPVLIRTPVLVD